MKSLKPSALYSSGRRATTSAVSAITGTSRAGPGRARKRSTVSMPVMPGMWISISTTSKGSVRSRSSASEPEVALIERWPNAPRISSTTRRFIGSSSTCRTISERPMVG